MPAGKLVHVVLDNRAAHRHPHGTARLARHPRWSFLTSPSALWLNAVESPFAKLARRRLKRGVFHSLVSLQAAINRLVAEADDTPGPFHRTSNPDTLVAAVKHRHQALNSIQQGQRRNAAE